MQTPVKRVTARDRLKAARHRLDMTQTVLELHRRAAARHEQEMTEAGNRLIRFLSEEPLLPSDFNGERISAAQEQRSVREQVLLEEKALMAAYEVVAAAYRLDLGRADSVVHPVPEQGTAIAPSNPVAHAVNYTAVYTRHREDSPTEHPNVLPADAVEFLLSRWQKVQSARILVHDSRIYSVALLGRYIELCPVEEPVPTEGDVLNAALCVYGVPSYPMAECGITYRVIPLDITADGEGAHTGARLFIRSGESADRPVQAHREPWTVTLHSPQGDEIGLLYSGSPLPGGIAEESADCAKFTAHWLRDNAPDHSVTS
ncbi:MAG TPA: hypothetical protein VIU15_27795 [Streptomyces sp.]